jgi:hypothetical protein
MEKLILDIKKPSKTTKMLNSIAWLFIVVSLVIFLVTAESVHRWGILFLLPVGVAMLFFLLTVLFFPPKKTGELFLTENKIRIFLKGKEKELKFDDVSKITVVLARNIGRFHRDWWPINDDPAPYNPSSKNHLLVKIKKGKSILVPYFLSTKQQENHLLTILKETSEKHKFGLKVK